jgi:hypothetical protein
VSAVRDHEGLRVRTVVVVDDAAAGGGVTRSTERRSSAKKSAASPLSAFWTLKLMSLGEVLEDLKPLFVRPARRRSVGTRVAARWSYVLTLSEIADVVDYACGVQRRRGAPPTVAKLKSFVDDYVEARS